MTKPKLTREQETAYKAYLEHFVELGQKHFYEQDPNRKPIANGATVIKQEPVKSISSDARVIADKITSLEELYKEIKAFNGCELKLTAKNTVIFDGDPKAQIMLIGEAPGASEDQMGIPFCGQSGKLLNSILLALNLKREQVYITNTVFWRPPANRRPTSQELEICRPFMEKHIALVKPKLILLVGSTAVEALLSSNSSMHSLRQKFVNYENAYLQGGKIPTTIIFHPSYLLRQPYKKKLMWQDLLKISKSILSGA